MEAAPKHDARHREAGAAGRFHRAAAAGRSAPPGKKRIIDYPRHDKYGWRRWTPSWKFVTGLCIAFLGSMVAAAGIGYAMVSVPNIAKTAEAPNT
ncbi:hypothetical protein SHIRM173S_00615 [Streptomyces hirsutus]